MTMKKTNKKELFIACSLISLAVALICVIPFSIIPYSAKILSKTEIIIKFFVFGIYTLIATAIITVYKYKKFDQSSKFLNVATYVPAFSFTAATLASLVVLIIKNYTKFAYTSAAAIIITSVVIMICIIFVACKIYTDGETYTKGKSILFDACIYAACIACVVFAYIVTIKFQGQGFVIKSRFAAFIPAGLAGIVYIIANVGFLILAKEEQFAPVQTIIKLDGISDAWKQDRMEAIPAEQEEIYNALYAFTKQKLNIVDGETVVVDNREEVEALEAQNQKLQAQLQHALNVINSSKEKIVATLKLATDNDNELAMKALKESLDVVASERQAIADAKAKLVEESNARIAELQKILDDHEAKLIAEAKALEEKARQKALEAEERAKAKALAEKNKPVIEPKFKDVVKFAESIVKDRDDIKVVVNAKETNYRFTCHNKPLFTLAESANDYRFTILSNTEDMRALLYQYAGIVTFEKLITFPLSKTDIQQLKVVYKGDETITIDVVKDLLTASLKTLLDAEALETAEKEAELARKERAKEAERALREKEREEKREALRAEKAAAKEAEANGEVTETPAPATDAEEAA